MRKSPKPKLRRAFRCAAAACVLALVGQAAQAQQDMAQRPERLKAMRAKGTKATLTVFPVTMLGEPNKDVADVLGLLLEQSVGMQAMDTTDTAFEPPADLAFDELPGKFGEFIRTNAVGTEYAMYAEFRGTPQTGAQEVRSVVVDKAGHVVWVDSQKPGDPDFKRIGAREPMTCCLLVAERFRAAMGLPELPDSPRHEGKMSKLAAEKSGTPDETESAAIERRLQTLKKTAPSRTVTVFPVRVGDEVDKQAAAYLTQLLNEGKLGQFAVGESAPRFDIPVRPNELRWLWDLARAFQGHLRANPVDTDYALMAEYIIRPGDKQVWAVHFVVCDRAGEWVIVDLQNDHHGDFNSVAPKTRDDCGRLVAKRLRGYLD